MMVVVIRQLNLLSAIKNCVYYKKCKLNPKFIGTYCIT